MGLPLVGLELDEEQHAVVAQIEVGRRTARRRCPGHPLGGLETGVLHLHSRGQEVLHHHVLHRAGDTADPDSGDDQLALLDRLEGERTAVAGQVGALDLEAGMVIAAVVVVVYTAAGGLLADVITDLVQGLALVLGLVAMVGYVLWQLGGISGALAELEARYGGGAAFVPLCLETFVRRGTPHDQAAPLSDLGLRFIVGLVTLLERRAPFCEVGFWEAYLKGSTSPPPVTIAASSVSLAELVDQGLRPNHIVMAAGIARLSV